MVAAAVQASLPRDPTATVTRPRQALCAEIYCCCCHLCATHCKLWTQSKIWPGRSSSALLSASVADRSLVDCLVGIMKSGNWCCAWLWFVCSYAVEWKRLVPGTDARDSLVGLGMLAAWHLVFWSWGIWITAALGIDGTVCPPRLNRIYVHPPRGALIMFFATGAIATEFGATTRPRCECNNRRVLQLLVRTVVIHVQDVPRPVLLFS